MGNGVCEKYEERKGVVGELTVDSEELVLVASPSSLTLYNLRSFVFLVFLFCCFFFFFTFMLVCILHLLCYYNDSILVFSYTHPTFLPLEPNLNLVFLVKSAVDMA